MIIYKATNLINGKIYIGQTIEKLNKRKQKHIYDSFKETKNKTYFHKSIFKNKPENFKWEIIDTAKSIYELNKKEEFWIKKLKSNNKNIGFNIHYGGLNKRHRKITKEKISKANKGRIFPEEHKKKMSLAAKKRKVSEFQKMMVSCKLKGRLFTGEHKKKISLAETGEKNHQAKLTEKDVIEIRTRIENGESNTDIAKDFPTSHSNISAIRRGKSWRHVK